MWIEHAYFFNMGSLEILMTVPLRKWLDVWPLKFKELNYVIIIDIKCYLDKTVILCTKFYLQTYFSLQFIARENFISELSKFV